MQIHFLSAQVALTKSFTLLADKTLVKDPYPLVACFTSHEHDITTAIELHKLIKSHSLEGHCLLKGELDETLNNESRKGHTRSDDKTEWVCLDFDRLSIPVSDNEADNANSVPTSDLINNELVKLGLGGVSYTLQWSASHGMPNTENTLSAHVFMLLSKPMHASELKLWLQSLNFTHYEDKLRLSRNYAALLYPLDVSTCQNDKLLYIAPPHFIGLNDPLNGERISFVKGKLDRLPVERLGQCAPEVIRTQSQAKKNELRKAAGLKATNAGTSFLGETEVQNKPGESAVTGIKDCGEYVRLNLNNGDSWAYWHRKDNFELLYNFKGELAYRLKEICPPYYSDLVAAHNAAASSPLASGDIVLGFSDHASSKYYRGTWNPETQHLDLHEARSETQVYHYYLSFGLQQPAFIPTWNMGYSVKEDFVVDMDSTPKRINMFRASSYMRDAVAIPVTKKFNVVKACPTIMRVITHMLGNDQEVITAFTQWFACLFQRLGKPKTCWVAHGDEGTGKGTWFDLIATPLLGTQNVIKVDINAIEDSFNAWMKNKLLIMVDEIDVDDFKEKGRASNIFKSRITETTFPCRDMRAVTYQYPNTFQFFFASNRPQPVFIPPSDRRYNVARYQHKKLSISDHERDVLIPQELVAYANYLAGVETSVNLATQICDTEDRREIARLGVTALQDVANMLKKGDFEGLWNMMPDEKHLSSIATLDADMAYASAYASLMKSVAQDILAETQYCKLTRDQLATIFRYTVGKNIPLSPKKFTSFLGHVNIQVKKIRTNDGTPMGIECNWHASDELKEDLAKALNDKKPRLKVVAK